MAYLFQAERKRCFMASKDGEPLTRLMMYLDKQIWSLMERCVPNGKIWATCLIFPRIRARVRMGCLDLGVQLAELMREVREDFLSSGYDAVSSLESVMNPNVSFTCEKYFSNFSTLIGSSTNELFPTNNDAVKTLFEAAVLITDLSSAMIVSSTNVGWCPGCEPSVPLLRASW